MDIPKQVNWDPNYTFTISNPRPSLCLNMIVKNESKIITRLLQSVVGVIDTYCICDTGSTDNTIEIITEFFKKNGISGKIVKEPFRDFGYNRTFALNACNSMENVDYLLLLDADMVFELNPEISADNFKEMLKNDSYTIFQGTNSFYYKNTRIVKNNKGITYWGVTHEYVNIPNGCIQDSFDKSICFINDIGDGGSKTNKFARDIELLKQGLIDVPNNDRYTFYLANTYHDSGQVTLAIETYKKRVEIGGWFEEIWYSHYRIGKCYAYSGDMTNAINAWMDAYEVFPNRIENLYEIIKYYRIAGKNKLSYAFYQLADKSRKLYPSRDYLFTEKDIYEYKLDFELSIIGYYTNPEKYNIAKCCMDVVNHPNVDEPAVKNVLSNYKFYTNALNDKCIPNTQIDLSQLYKIGDTLSNELSEFYPSTPTLCIDSTGTKLTVIKRFVNYRIDENGGYVNKEHIETKNVVSTFTLNSAKNSIQRTNTPEFILNYNTILDNLYVGLEDVRIYENNNNMYYMCNRGINYHSIRVEHGKISLANKTTDNSVLLEKPGSSPVEKNWVILEEKNDDIYCIYKWFPLTIGKLTKKTPTDEQPTLFETIHEHETPGSFKHLRGSTNGVRIQDEIWFLCHTVSYEDRRYYYHMFVVVDATTYKVKSYTPWFTFEKKKVEYSLGFCHLKDLGVLFIGYSLMDSETKYMTINESVIRESLIPV